MCIHFFTHVCLCAVSIQQVVQLTESCLQHPMSVSRTNSQYATSGYLHWIASCLMDRLQHVAVQLTFTHGWELCLVGWTLVGKPPMIMCPLTKSQNHIQCVGME